MRAILCLDPPESRRLIARAVAALDEVVQARRSGTIIVANGVTNAYVAEELLGRRLEEKCLFAAGLVADGRLCLSPEKERLPALVLRQGEPASVPWTEALDGFGAGDVFIKGGNALDPQGAVGVFMAHERGGTVGAALGTLRARGSHLVMPVGLEKLVPSVPAAAALLGTRVLDLSHGLKVGMMVVVGARVVTEAVALERLFGVNAVHAASGGVGASQGAVVLAIDGEERAVRAAFEYVSALKGEEPPAIRREDCAACGRGCEWRG
ncbi:MAG: hypothetical protein K6T75_00190 [Acetobacteraceae bacterium]|nr:hypothetical protein [Acetobacteraceae bacterium]